MSNSIDSIMSNATSGLRAAQAGISVLSDNIANAGVAGYTAKQLGLSAFDVGGQSNGVRQGLVSRSVDEALQASVWSSASTVGALSVRSEVLNTVNASHGVPGDGTSLPDTLTALQSSFTLLQSDPSSATQQAAVAGAAATLAGKINTVANVVAAARNGVQTQIVAAVDTLNAALTAVQSTTHDLIAATGASQETGALEDRRDAALQTLSGLVDVHYDKQANGDVTILGQNGFSIPLASRFSTQAVTLSPAASYGTGSVPAILLQSSNAATPPVDVTARLMGGRMGELVHLRDTTLPAYTTTLDGFSAKLANKFADQGLQLFSDATGLAPASAYAGLSSLIRVNPAVEATPSLIRDGTAGSAFAINPSTGPAAFSDLIDRIVRSSFAASGAITSLDADAQGFVASQSAATARAAGDLTGATSYQTALATKFSDASGVNVDNELGLMIKLQNSYQANARVIQATQSLFTALLNATVPV